MIRDLIKQASKIGNSANIIHYIEYLYQFDMFKNTLNLSLSLIKHNRLSFEIYPKESLAYIGAEGMCKTNQILGINKYTIVLKGSNPYIIVHELSHMVENELNLSLEQEFINIIYQDIEQNFKQSNPLVQKLIGQIIFKEIQAYNNIKSRASELFARYFELFAWAKEVCPKDREYLICTRDLDKVFLKTNQWKKKSLDLQIINALDEEIKKYSNKSAVKDINKVQVNWTNRISFRKKTDSIFDT